MAFLQCEFHSDVLGRACSMNVLIPQKAATQIGMDSAGASGRAEYPVLYLLHGLSDNHSIWMRRTSIEQVNQLIGVQDGAWLILHIGVDGTVSLYHVFHDGVLTWALLDASTAFLVA